MGESYSANPSQKELLVIVDEEADRLGRLVTEAIQMARIEAGRVYLNRKMESAHEMISHSVFSLQASIGDRPIHVIAPDSLPLVEVDPELIEIALRLVLDNALEIFHARHTNHSRGPFGRLASDPGCAQ